MPNPIAIRLGSLEDPAQQRADELGVPLRQFIKHCVAEKLNLKPESLPMGNPSIASLADERHSKKRWSQIVKAWKQLPAAQQSNIVRDYCDEPSAETDRARLGQLRRVWAGLHRNQQIECSARVVAMVQS